MLKLPKPLTVPDITHIEVTDSRLRKAQNDLLVEVRILDEAGGAPWTGEIILRPPVKTTVKIGDEEDVQMTGGQCNRVVQHTHPPLHQPTPYGIGTFFSEVAFANALVARKAPDEHAALEAAGVADGWLIPHEV
jgi:hypothetical protein